MPRIDALTAQYITPSVVTALTSLYVRLALFVQITLTTGPIYLWSGQGTINWNNHSWQGVGNFGAISSIEEGANVYARGITLTLSGFDSSLIGDALTEYQQGLPVLVYLGLFDSNNNLLTNPINSWTGFTDQPTIGVTGPEASITVACENRLVSMNTSVELRYNQGTQAIFYPGDLGFSYVTEIQDITIYFGRHPSSSNNFGVQGTP